MLKELLSKPGLLPCSVLPRRIVTGETLVLLANTVKNYRSASLLARTQSLLVLVPTGEQKQGLKEQGRQKTGGQHLGGQELPGQSHPAHPSPVWQKETREESPLF